MSSETFKVLDLSKVWKTDAKSCIVICSVVLDGMDPNLNATYPAKVASNTLWAVFQGSQVLRQRRFTNGAVVSAENVAAPCYRQLHRDNFFVEYQRHFERVFGLLGDLHIDVAAKT